MKTKLKTETWNGFELYCSTIIGDENAPDYYEKAKPCGGHLDLNGICKQCGKLAESHTYTNKSGLAYYQVTVSHRDGDRTAKFSAKYDENQPTDEYDRKLIAALKRAGGNGNAVWMDGCKQPGSYNGTFGWSVPQNRGGGFSCNERFLVEMI